MVETTRSDNSRLHECTTKLYTSRQLRSHSCVSPKTLLRTKNCRSCKHVSSLYSPVYGQTKQYLAVQYHQLCKQVQALQVSYHLHPPLWLWNMDPACWLWEKDPGLRNQMPVGTSPHLLLGAQDQWLVVEQDQLPCGPTGASSGNCEETETCMVTQWYSLFKTILHGILENGRSRGRQRKC